jgi:hypothetical protein
MWRWLDRAPLGRNEGDVSWFHRYDEYAAVAAVPGARPPAPRPASATGLNA